MKYILFIFSIFLFFTGCQNNDVEIPNLKTYNSFDKFNYTKEDITFFEKEFENILSIENVEILKQYEQFYSKNSNYFLNGKQKVQTLKQKIEKLKKDKDSNSDLYLLQKAKKIIKEDKKETIKIYKQLAKRGNIKAQRELVEIYKINNPSIALKWLEKLVESNDIASMKEYASANIYMVRPVIVQDLKKALETYEKLAEFGELSSIMRLGNIYEYGYHKEVAPKDKEKSLEYYELAASKNYEIAQKKLYEIYSCKKCKPDRYNPEKAKVLQKILVKYLDKKIIEELDKKEEKITLKIKPKAIEKKEVEIKKVVEKPKTEEISKKKIETKETVEAPKVEEAKKETTIITKQEKSKKEIVKCYDMEVASEMITDDCKNKIQTILQKKKYISRITILPVIDKSDIAYFEKEDSKKSLLESLAKNRVLEIEKYLKENIENTPDIKKYDYHVISKKKNKGVILKFY
ncbi:tetratricopeptide repeat protein [Arcobacter sp. LA11]|uniref:tetratricopeptide repeat protein n=1 Tax=Arcobacter sp. LA11 TaxID=1898176 RepID=UPI00116051E9|nr:SEL1-like repeat protein [Arcobacter sp. LA11]